eukprot:NODE_821_length_1166_cov_316.976723_g577_i0.p1 GENE.NODE_821_length_1166_cov_316.976723_g577_i0~~NODE_821_length_1166_cov_316.976723_g577_i0.p1  ORF type:complete len:260 (+),score=72.28 NODE_821_length_1166_cov_316.976723_g577_i0:89-868(+)
MHAALLFPVLECRCLGLCLFVRLCTPARTFASVLSIKVAPRVSQKSTSVYSFLAVTWGLMANVDFQSETYRWMGGARFTVEAVRQVAVLPSFRARVHYRLAEDQADGASGGKQPGSYTLPTVASAVNFDELFQPPAEAGAPTPPPQATWETVEADFSYFYLNNASHASPDHVPAPTASLSDGRLVLTYATNCTRPRLTSLMLSAGTGAHVGLPYVKQMYVTELVLEPLIMDTQLDVDGERYPNARAHIQVLPGAWCCAC